MFRYWNGYSSWKTDFLRMLMFVSHEIGGDWKNCWIFVTGWLLEMFNSCQNVNTSNYQFNSKIKSICMKLFCVDYVKIRYYLVYISIYRQFTILHFYVTVHTDVYGWVYLDPFFTPCNFCRDVTHLLLIIKRQ